MITRVLVSALIGSVTMFALGFLIYGLLLAEYMKTAMGQNASLMKDPPNFVLLFVSNLAFAWLLAFVFERWAGIKTFASGLLGGALIVLPMMIGYDLNFYATTNLLQSFTPMIVDILATTVLASIAGGVIGFVLGKLGKTT